MSDWPDGLEVEFEALSLQVGHYCSGRTPDGRRVVAEVTRVSWWLAPVMAVLRIVQIPGLAIQAMQRGIDLKLAYQEER